MSAIFGIISKYGKPVVPEFVETMKKTLQHRAIDGQGFYQTTTVFIGHYKFISNIHQKKEQLPLEDELNIITADARIDNRNELIKILEIIRPDVSDSYLVLQAFYKWGNNCTNYLEGEFAFIILNKKNNSIFSATDHIGFRSFYYYNSPDYFIFSSELKGISALEFVPKEYNEKILVEYLSCNTSDITPYKNIHILLGGSHLILNDQMKLSTSKYWKLRPSGKYNFKKDADWPECLKELMYTAIRNRIDTDLPVGVQLSGGLDSSFVAAITSQILKEKNRQLISISSTLPPNYNGPATDEQFYINLLGSFLGNVDQYNVNLPKDVGLFTDINKTIDQKGSFSIGVSQVIQRHIFEAAKERKVNVLLNGFGGDTLISNPGKMVIFELLKNLKLFSALNLIHQKNKQGYSFKSILKSDIINQLFFIKRIQQKRRLNNLFLTKELKKSVLQSSIPKMPAFQDFIIYRTNKGGFGKSIFTQNNLSSYFNINYNSPIFDKNIFEFFIDLPQKQLILKGKERSLIRRAMTELVPVEIYNRIDKQKFLPDFSERFFIDLETSTDLLIANQDSLKTVGIKVDELIESVSNIINTKKIPKATSGPLMVHLLSLHYFYHYFFGNNKDNL